MKPAQPSPLSEAQQDTAKTPGGSVQWTTFTELMDKTWRTLCPAQGGRCLSQKSILKCAERAVFAAEIPLAHPVMSRLSKRARQNGGSALPHSRRARAQEYL